MRGTYRMMPKEEEAKKLREERKARHAARLAARPRPPVLPATREKK